jgi:hypothetical protein
MDTDSLSDGEGGSYVKTFAQNDNNSNQNQTARTKV